ncbi:flagellar export protein FliJ [Diaminobutyricibacter tongyongensis]|uniref:Flagellar export protein FliJ n=1 Tax=Leifsonia tongyongensis TaxID=1268043 RepID=A0A6L9XVA4_9MICO|nr:flagellar export protein FliJ [Diaminobutyricibacter tongyongensis]NEN05185.1 flagellar export protein FliJ [Diaminobutyricibacter tongyongensis]
MMPKPFSLAGLLRLRQTEQDIAGAELARANARIRDNATTERRARRALAEYGDTATSTETLRAIAAARQASATMLSELSTILEEDLAAHERARSDYLAARMRFAGLEKTERKHREAAIAEDLKTEQQALDELTGSRTAREKGDE